MNLTTHDVKRAKIHRPTAQCVFVLVEFKHSWCQSNVVVLFYRKTAIIKAEPFNCRYSR